MDDQKKGEMAAQLFTEFSGHRPARDGIVMVNAEDVCCIIGPITYIGYEAKRDGKIEQYMHKFENGRPLLAISHDGSQAYILGGEYEFTEKGFEPG